MMETGFVMFTGPYPPESRTMTSPPLATAPTAAAKLRQGETLVHGFVSTPLMETNVRLWAKAADAAKKERTMIRRKP